MGDTFCHSLFLSLPKMNLVVLLSLLSASLLSFPAPTSGVGECDAPLVRCHDDAFKAFKVDKEDRGAQVSEGLGGGRGTFSSCTVLLPNRQRLLNKVRLSSEKVGYEGGPCSKTLDQILLPSTD